MSATSNNDIARAIFSATKDKSSAEQQLIAEKILSFLQRRHLFARAPSILFQLRKIINEDEKKTIVRVRSAEKLGKQTAVHLAEILKKRYSTGEIVLEETIDERLLGGMRLQIDDDVIDLSIKNKIAKLQEYLTDQHEQ